jgi:hypothetical protein
MQIRGGGTAGARRGDAAAGGAGRGMAGGESLVLPGIGSLGFGTLGATSTMGGDSMLLGASGSGSGSFTSGRVLGRQVRLAAWHGRLLMGGWLVGRQLERDACSP